MVWMSDQKDGVDEENGLTQDEVGGVLNFNEVAIGLKPVVVCFEDEVLMELEGAEVKKASERGFFGFGSKEARHVNLRYRCPVCGRSFYHDMEQKREGCFIATAAYGTPMSKEIDVLRKFRDSYLKTRVWGRFFINVYYTFSPPIAGLIGRSVILRKVVRGCIWPFVKVLNKIYGET